MGLETITFAQVLSGLSAGASIIGGIQQNKEAQRQARFAREEAADRARVEARENIELEKRQKLSFLKSGVALEGSPLLLLAETRDLGDENIDATIGTGQRRAKSFQEQGRTALLGGLVGAAGTLGEADFKFSKSTGGGGRITSKGVPIPGRKPGRFS